MSSTITVVLPAYQEREVVATAVQRLLSTIDEEGITADVRVVLDGPDQESLSSLNSICDARIRVIELLENSGKGAALRRGALESTSDYTAFLDADLDIHPKSLLLCVKALSLSRDERVVCAYGSKFHSQSEVDYPIVRRIASRVFRLYIRLLFQIDCSDSQTGVKVFRTSALHQALKESRECRFLFDLELLSNLSAKNYRFVEAPVILHYQYSSTIDLRSALKMVLDATILRMRQKRMLHIRSAEA